MEKLFQTLSNPNLSTNTCDKCKESLYMPIDVLGETRYVRKSCQCERDEYERNRKEEMQRQKNLVLDRLKTSSLMDKRFFNSTLENWNDEVGNGKLKTFCEKYVQNWREAKKENIGVLLYGAAGTGKTYACFAVANELIAQLETVVAVSMTNLLSRIRETYSKNESEPELINLMGNCDLLVLDDLGAENRTDWVTSKIYQIIDTRYRAGKPLFITTNLTLEGLREKLSEEVDRTYDRIMEVCVPFEVKGKSVRSKLGGQKRDKLIELMRT